MPILNKNKYPHITPNGVETKQYNRILLSDQIFANGLFWYVEVESINSFREDYLRQAIPLNILEFIQKNKVILIIANYWEADLSIVESIYSKLIIQCSIQERSVILLTGARDIESHIRNVSLLHNKSPIRVVLTNEFEARLNQCEKINQTVSVQTSTPSKRFVCLNRNWRSHRPFFVSLLVMHDLLKYGYVSLIEENNQRNNWESCWSIMLQDFPYYEGQLNQNRQRIEKSTPLIVDKNNLVQTPDWYDSSLVPIYTDSYFSIVTETFFKKTNTRFLTEKTLKTIVHKHPFILISVPKSLEYFREKGYKTFHPYIDESYDLEFDDEKRMGMILKETERLCLLSDEELTRLMLHTKEICEYNYEVLLNKKSFCALLVDNK